jgi:hypothetical protein
VEHSLYCSFFWEGERNLVVAGANVLRVFQLVPETGAKVRDCLHCKIREFLFVLPFLLGFKGI